ncbi:MAG: hypothetical protein WKF60_05775 [Ilumatobacter sp.]
MPGPLYSTIRLPLGPARALAPQTRSMGAGFTAEACGACLTSQ